MQPPSSCILQYTFSRAPRPIQRIAADVDHCHNSGCYAAPLPALAATIAAQCTHTDTNSLQIPCKRDTMQDIKYKIQDIHDLKYKIYDTDTRYKIQDTSHKIQDTKHKVLDTRDNK